MSQADFLSYWARCAFWGRRAGFAVPWEKPSRVLPAGRGGRRLLPERRFEADRPREPALAGAGAAGGMGVPDVAISRTT